MRMENNEKLKKLEKKKTKLENKIAKYERKKVIEKLKELEEKFIIVGDATEEFYDLLNKKINCEILEKKIELSSDIGKYALNKYFKDENVAKIPHEILPIYLRKAQPEREV